ncbi:MAG: FAD-binding protein, partial [Coriobacteriales bacterium]|nr:FAD-binding protein [Coriobacteriales bacterium]
MPKHEFQQEELTNNPQGVSRRSFLVGGVAAGALAVAGGLLAGCSPKEPAASDGSTTPDATSAAPEAPASIDAEYTTDLLIIGVGGSGMTCCVQASLNGTDYIALEKSSIVGGNANFVEGMFGIGSTFQKEQGIDVTSAQIIEAEMQRGQYRQNGSMWLDLCNKSAENIDWCLEQGVL